MFSENGSLVLVLVVGTTPFPLPMSSCCNYRRETHTDRKRRQSWVLFGVYQGCLQCCCLIWMETVESNVWGSQSSRWIVARGSLHVKHFLNFLFSKITFQNKPELLRQLQSHLYQENGNRMYCRWLCICSRPRCLWICSWRTHRLAFYVLLRDLSILNLACCSHTLDCTPVDSLMKMR